MQEIVKKYNTLRAQRVKPEAAHTISGMANLMADINALPRKERIAKAVELALMGVKPYAGVSWLLGKESAEGAVFTLVPVGVGKPPKCPEPGVKLLSTLIKPNTGLEVWEEYIHFTGTRAIAGNGYYVVDVPEIGPEEWRGACVKPSIAEVDSEFKYPDYHQLLPCEYSASYPVNLSKWRGELDPAVKLHRAILGVIDEKPKCTLPITLPEKRPARFDIGFLLRIVTTFDAYGETDAVFSIEQSKSSSMLVLRGIKCFSLLMGVEGDFGEFQLSPMIIDTESAELF